MLLITFAETAQVAVIDLASWYGIFVPTAVRYDEAAFRMQLAMCGEITRIQRCMRMNCVVYISV